MRYEVSLLRKATEDLDAITDFLASRSRLGACGWLDAVGQTLDALELNPGQFGLAPENDFLPFEIRQAIFCTGKGMSYRALFTVAGTQVRVLRIRGPGQDLLSDDDI